MWGLCLCYVMEYGLWTMADNNLGSGQSHFVGFCSCFDINIDHKSIRSDRLQITHRLTLDIQLNTLLLSVDMHQQQPLGHDIVGILQFEIITRCAFPSSFLVSSGTFKSPQSISLSVSGPVHFLSFPITLRLGINTRCMDNNNLMKGAETELSLHAVS